jgi:5-methylcytosine-specific restriction protein A
MNRPIYRTRAWKAVRLAVLRRDRYQCQIRLPGCRGRANAADHIIELEDRGAPFDMGNLQAACATCNSGKANKRRAQRDRGLAVGVVRAW